jgi:hypothetical protein
MAQEGLGTAVMPSFCEHICYRYKVRVDALRPEVPLSFYRITRTGRDTLATLDQFTSMFTEAAKEDPTGFSESDIDE